MLLNVVIKCPEHVLTVENHKSSKEDRGESWLHAETQPRALPFTGASYGHLWLCCSFLYRIRLKTASVFLGSGRVLSWVCVVALLLFVFVFNMGSHCCSLGWPGIREC